MTRLAIGLAALYDIWNGSLVNGHRARHLEARHFPLFSFSFLRTEARHALTSSTKLGCRVACLASQGSLNKTAHTATTALATKMNLCRYKISRPRVPASRSAGAERTDRGSVTSSPRWLEPMLGAMPPFTWSFQRPRCWPVPRSSTGPCRRLFWYIDFRPSLSSSSNRCSR